MRHHDFGESWPKSAERLVGAKDDNRHALVIRRRYTAMTGSTEGQIVLKRFLFLKTLDDLLTTRTHHHRVILCVQFNSLDATLHQLRLRR